MHFALVKKELKQNLLLYLLPYFCGFILIVLNARHQIPLSKEWQNILAVLFPVSFAGAFGLQSFDLEENGQTRDFLLTRPFSASQVINVKYMTGLAVLLPITLLWSVLFLPDALKLPDLSDWSSFWWLTLLLLVITVYTQSFTAAIFVHGPLKLLAAIGMAFIIGTWFFYSWFEGITALYWFESFRYPAFCWIILGVFTVALALFQIKVARDAATWYLARLPAAFSRKKVWAYLIIIPVLPFLLHGITACRQPAIKPFHQLFYTAFSSQPWFITLEGQKQPTGYLYACADVTGKLGLTEVNHMPRVVYAGSDPSQPLANISWSPDGRKILFREGTHLKVFDVRSGNVRSLLEGDLGLWASDSTHLITAKIVHKQTKDSDWGSFDETVYQLSLVNLEDGSVQPYYQLTSSGSSLAWDSVANRLLAIDISGYLVSMNFNEKNVSYIPIFESQTKEPIFYSKFEYSGSGKNHFYLTVFSIDVSKPEALKEKLYTIRGYLFNAEDDSFTPLFKLSGVRFQDVILTDKPQQLLVRSNNLGIYHKITIPQEASIQ